MSYRIPTGEVVCVTYIDKAGKEVNLITHKPITDMYYLYDIDGDKITKIGKDQSPIVLESKFGIDKKIKGE